MQIYLRQVINKMIVNNFMLKNLTNIKYALIFVAQRIPAKAILRFQLDTTITLICIASKRKGDIYLTKL